MHSPPSPAELERSPIRVEAWRPSPRAPLCVALRPRGPPFGCPAASTTPEAAFHGGSRQRVTLLASAMLNLQPTSAYFSIDRPPIRTPPGFRGDLMARSRRPARG